MMMRDSARVGFAGVDCVDRPDVGLSRKACRVASQLQRKG